jgi:cyclase
MKRLSALCAVAAVIAALAGCEKKQVEGTGLVKLSPNVYAMIATGPTAAEGLGANSGFVVGRDGVLVVDTRYTPALANELLSAIRYVTQAPIKYVVNTHYHPDHTWGNMVFKEQGAVIYARPETREALEIYSPAYLDFYRERSKESAELLKDVRVVPPDSDAVDGMTFDLGGVTAVIRCFGPAHTAGDCIVIVPKAKVAFTGGIVSNGYHPNMGDPGADYDNWLTTLRRLGEMKIRYIVPGQGKVCGPEALETEAAYITDLRNQCELDIKRMVPMEQAAASITIPGTEGYLQPNILPFNVQAIYRREVPRIVRPNFTLDLPAEFQIMDGGGSPKIGFIRWSAALKEGSLEIEIRWSPTASREVIAPDIASAVSQYAGSGAFEMKTTGSTRIDIDGEKALASRGSWTYKRETGLPGGGIWTWSMVVRGGTLYSLRMSTDAGFDKAKERQNMAFLEKLVSRFRVRPRAS